MKKNQMFELAFENLPENGELSAEFACGGAASAEGTEICGDSDAPGVVKADGKAFRFENGKLFHPFGTTVYALINQSDELIEQTMQTLSKAPFNKIRMCVFPKDYDFHAFSGGLV